MTWNNADAMPKVPVTPVDDPRSIAESLSGLADEPRRRETFELDRAAVERGLRGRGGPVVHVLRGQVNGDLCCSGCSFRVTADGLAALSLSLGPAEEFRALAKRAHAAFQSLSGVDLCE